MNRDDILATAANLTRGDRHESYGAWSENAETIAAMWTAYLGGRMPEARDVAPMMALLKIVRLRRGPHRDSWIDLAGYAGLGGEVDERD